MTHNSLKHEGRLPEPSEWERLGGKNIWLPYSQMKSAREPVIAVSTQGSRIRLSNGCELIDGVASWWTACHGYNHPHIHAEVRSQLERMPHVMFGGINHEPALRLAKRLANLLPGDLNRVFFSDSGSVAVEVAMKMAVQYWLNRGHQGRTKFVSFRHGYHGDTAACMSVCDPSEGMHAHFKGYLAEQYVASLPCNNTSAAALDGLLRHERSHIAAVLVEPLVQGVGGMKFHSPTTLQRISELCQKHDVLLIADEIFTGFGRTGSMFACEEAEIVPDIMCLGKALTGGTMTLAATVAREHVFDAFWADDQKKAFMHGPTYMANPLACTAANASLDVFEEEPRLAQAAAMETTLREGLEACRALPGVADVRAKGAIGVVEMEGAFDVEHLRQELFARNACIRVYEGVIWLTPALNINKEDLNSLMMAIFESLKHLVRKS